MCLPPCIVECRSNARINVVQHRRNSCRIRGKNYLMNNEVSLGPKFISSRDMCIWQFDIAAMWNYLAAHYVIVISQDEYDILVIKSEAKLMTSVNNKDIIRMHLGYNWLISQKTVPINASFVK